MKIKKTIVVGCKITPQLKEKIDKIIEEMPEMDMSTYIRRALTNQVEEDEIEE